jgi:hypothetical protein
MKHRNHLILRFYRSTNHQDPKNCAVLRRGYFVNRNPQKLANVPHESQFLPFLIKMVRVFSAVALLATCCGAFQQSSFLGRQSLSVLSHLSDSALCMKTIAVFGASGLTASECVYQALKNGDNVVGLTR